MVILLAVCFQAYQQGMYGGRYVWMLQGKYANEWWRTVTPSDDGCWPDEVALAADGYFSVRPMGAPMAHETAQSRLVHDLKEIA